MCSNSIGCMGLERGNCALVGCPDFGLRKITGRDKTQTSAGREIDSLQGHKTSLLRPRAVHTTFLFDTQISNSSRPGHLCGGTDVLNEPVGSTTGHPKGGTLTRLTTTRSLRSPSKLMKTTVLDIYFCGGANVLNQQEPDHGIMVSGLSAVCPRRLGLRCCRGWTERAPP